MRMLIVLLLIISPFVDDFSGYDANWQVITNQDSGFGASNSDRVEGAASRYAAVSLGESHGVDYSTWSSDDYFCAVYKGGVAAYKFGYSSGHKTNDLPQRDDWTVLAERKAELIPFGESPSWYVDWIWSVGEKHYTDNWRWSKKDPESSRPNDFGSNWDYEPESAPWFVYTDVCDRCAGNAVPGEGHRLVSASGVVLSARVLIFQDGRAGIWIGDYALVLDSARDELIFLKDNTVLSVQSMSIDVGVWYDVGWTGAMSSHDVPSGLVVVEGLARFDDVKLAQVVNSGEHRIYLPLVNR